MDLARRMIELSGLTVKGEQNPDGDIEVDITGLRPGEKLYEELLIGDNPKPTLHPRRMKPHENCIPRVNLEAKLNVLKVALSVNDIALIRHLMEKLVSSFVLSNEIGDWVYLEQEAEGMVLSLGE